MRSQSGFTYLGVLLAIAILGIGLTAASQVWVTTATRQRIEQLNWVGHQYVQAIGSYYEASPGRVKSYPRRLQDLLEDRRFAFVRRHLRQAYVNPLTGVVDWEVIGAGDGGIRGLRARLAPDSDAASGGREFVYVPVIR
jgi:type II secretory pathway pseudopilin PulG